MHFVGFKKDLSRLSKAAMIFGAPDFVHYYWDVRAQQEIAPGDVAIFAVGSDADEPRAQAFNDSEIL